MNLLWTLLLIPLAFASAPNCKDMGAIVEFYERDLKWKKIQPEKDGVLVQGICNEKLLAPIIEMHKPTTPQKQVLVENGCKGLAALEERIASLENQQSLLTGFQKLKADLAENKKQVASNDLKTAKRSGLDFISGLNTAKSLETMLDTENLLLALKKVPAQDRDSMEKFKAKVKEACAEYKEKACDPKNFSPNEISVHSINELIDNSDVQNEKVIESWKNALKIKKKDSSEDSTYSFTQMHAELAKSAKTITEGKLDITRDELRAIQSLPDFKNDHGLTLESMKKDIKVYELMQEYKFHVEDLKLRQEFEVQSKAALITKEFSNIQSELSDSERNACANAMGDFSNSIACLNALKKFARENPTKVGNQNVSRINEITDSVAVTQNYLNTLNNTHEKCLQLPVTEEFKKNPDLPKECVEAMGDIDNNLKIISTELPMLYAIKEKIGAQNVERMKIRNFALDKYASMGCDGTGVAQINLQCDNQDLSISRNAEVLYSSVQQLLVIRPEKSDNVNFKVEEINELCDKGESFPYKEKLCSFGKETPEDKIIQPDHKKHEYQAPVVAPDDGDDKERDAMIAGLGMVAMTAAQEYGKRWQNQSTFNPYMYNYGPWSGGPMLGISDQILFNARYYGAYGYYMPTLGYQPHTAFPVMDYKYTPFNASRSPYFTTAR